jgi:hypothetical protein
MSADNETGEDLIEHGSPDRGIALFYAESY